MNENTVKAQLHRGMERLRQAFSGYDYVVVLCALGSVVHGTVRLFRFGPFDIHECCIGRVCFQ